MSAAFRLESNQTERLHRFGVDRTIDLHCHCLPGLDDGPKDLEQSLALCRALVNDGTTVVVATPHQLGRFDRRNHGSAVLEAVAALQHELDTRGIPLLILPGGDVRVDERLPQLLEQGLALPMGASQQVLLELPSQTWVAPESVMPQLHDAGYRGVLSHPERYRHVQQDPLRAEAWIEQGALLQITAGSLLGDFGPQAMATAWHLVTAGHAHVVASDAHDATARPPRMTPALLALRRRMGLTVARQLCVDHPRELLGDAPVPAAHEPQETSA